MLERPVTRVRRALYIATIIILIAVAVHFVVLFVGLPVDAPVSIRVGLIMGFTFSLGGASFCAWILKRGSENIRTHTTFGGQLIWTFMVFVMVLFMLLGGFTEDAAKGTRLILIGLAFWSMFAIPQFIANRVNQSELRTREQILKLELGLAQLVQKSRNGE